MSTVQSGPKIANPYNIIAYPGHPYVQTHPDRLATLAFLHGMKPTPVERCRVLELGCGDGANLIPMALQLLGSDFLGIDLASLPIRKGRQQIFDLGLANIRLEEADLMDFPSASGPFDYIIAHGLYSWVSPAVQKKIMEIVQTCLTPQGVAYISYNTLPGGHFRLMLREMMQYHVRKLTSPEKQVSQGASLIKLIAGAQIEPNAYGALMQQEWEHRLSQRTPGAIFHDELGEHNRHFYFHEFMEQAAHHHLQFLAEAEFSEMHSANFLPAVDGLLKQLEDDILSRQQYLDFLKGRRFRQTLLCHDKTPIDRTILPERIMSLWAASIAEPSTPLSLEKADSSVRFRGPAGSSITTAHPLIKAGLFCLGETWPLPISFEALWERAQTRLMAQASSLPLDTPADRIDLAKTLFTCYRGGLVELHCWAPSLAPKPGDRPLVSPLARMQTTQENVITTLCHTSVEISGALEKKLLQLLDGTRDRVMILKALEEAILSGEVTLPEAQDGEPIPEIGKVRAVLAASLESQLNRLARLGLLLA
jgi:methyltransferase-like protein/cyclopropane fatty-acyl-phospholipid synthase-like methyltransferase